MLNMKRKTDIFVVQDGRIKHNLGQIQETTEVDSDNKKNIKKSCDIFFLFFGNKMTTK